MLTPGKKIGGLALAAGLTVASTAGADLARVAVAANFAAPMGELARAFETVGGHEVVVSSGSSGKLLAQIEQGAPFDLFFSADRGRVERLLTGGRAVAGSDWVYARGRLVLWSADPAAVDDGGDALRREFRHLAIANPRLAPYGQAARETLESLGLWAALEPRLVLGESVTQAFQFVASGAAELGLVALSQVRLAGGEGSVWEVPSELHRPIEQGAVALTDAPAAEAFARWVRSADGREIIRRYGYETP